MLSRRTPFYLRRPSSLSRAISLALRRNSASTNARVPAPDRPMNVRPAARMLSAWRGSLRSTPTAEASAHTRRTARPSAARGRSRRRRIAATARRRTERPARLRHARAGRHRHDAVTRARNLDHGIGHAVEQHVEAAVAQHRVAVVERGHRHVGEIGALLEAQVRAGEMARRAASERARRSRRGCLAFAAASHCSSVVWLDRDSTAPSRWDRCRGSRASRSPRSD